MYSAEDNGFSYKEIEFNLGELLCYAIVFNIYFLSYIQYKKKVINI